MWCGLAARPNNDANFSLVLADCLYSTDVGKLVHSKSNQYISHEPDSKTNFTLSQSIANYKKIIKKLAIKENILLSTLLACFVCFLSPIMNELIVMFSDYFGRANTAHRPDLVKF